MGADEKAGDEGTEQLARPAEDGDHGESRVLVSPVGDDALHCEDETNLAQPDQTLRNSQDGDVGGGGAQEGTAEQQPDPAHEEPPRSETVDTHSQRDGRHHRQESEGCCDRSDCGGVPAQFKSPIRSRRSDRLGHRADRGKAEQPAKIAAETADHRSRAQARLIGKETPRAADSSRSSDQVLSSSGTPSIRRRSAVRASISPG